MSIYDNNIQQIRNILMKFLPIEISNKIIFEYKVFSTPSASIMKPLINMIKLNQGTVSIISPKLYTVGVEFLREKKVLNKHQKRFFTRDENYKLKFMYDEKNLFK